MAGKYYAHSLPGKPQEEWQLLEDYLRNVAEMAKGFADEFGEGGMGGNIRFKIQNRNGGDSSE